MKFLKQFVPVVAVAFIGGQVVGNVNGKNSTLTLALGLVTAVLAILVYRWSVRWAEERPVEELAGNGAASRLLLGIVIGAVWFAAVIGNIYGLGDFKIHGGIGTSSGPDGLFGFMAAAAVTEELIFRGLLFRIIERAAGTWLTLVLTSVLFGLYHMANPDATLWGAACIAIEAGGTLGAAYAATRSLWAPIGIHFAWNFVEAGIFGATSSGNGRPQGLFDGVFSGPSLITGGNFGPEASLYSVGTGLIVTIIFLWIARRRGNLVPMRREARVSALAAIS